MNELALFAGAGGGLLASKWLLGWRTVCYIENDLYCIEKVLIPRIREGLLDDAPIWDDVKTFFGEPWRGAVDIITAGFPCQPFSVAGRGRAEADDRNLWPDTIRIIREVRPRWVLLENVPGLLAGSHGYYGRILGELAESGYSAPWDCVSAEDVGAPHPRERLWIVAHAPCFGRRGWDYGDAPRGERPLQTPGSGSADQSAYVADTHKKRRPGRARVFGQRGRGEPADGDSIVSNIESQQTRGILPGRLQTHIGTDSNRTRQASWWATEPELGRVAYGVAHRVDRLKALGNGQVPIVVKVVWELLT